MKGFIECYNENKSCDLCSSTPVRIVKIDENDKVTNICMECFKKEGSAEISPVLKI